MLTSRQFQEENAKANLPGGIIAGGRKGLPVLHESVLLSLVYCTVRAIADPSGMCYCHAIIHELCHNHIHLINW